MTTEFKNLTNLDLLKIYNELLIEIKPIPFKLIQEINKRKLIKTYKGTFTS